MLQKVIDTICRQTGWKSPKKIADNHVHFLLENNMDLSLFSPNGQDCFFIVTLTSIPNNETKETFLHTLANKTAGMYKKRKSILSLSANNITLHRVLKQHELSETSILQTAKEILNDADIWNTVLGKTQIQTSPFSFSGITF